MSSAGVTCALTGPIATKADNPNLPTTPEEIAKRTVALIEETTPALVQLSTGVGLDVLFTIMLRRGVTVESNAELVERLVSVARSLEREHATVAEVEERLTLPRREEAR